MKQNNDVTLVLAQKEDFEKFKDDLQRSFSVAVVETFGSISGGPIPSDNDIEECFNSPTGTNYHILSNGKVVGGVIVEINEVTQHNSLAFFFILPEVHSRGIGYKTWKAIEEKYPETKVWETHTPYFEKRNINFYVNKCGFHIVEYYNRHHSDPHLSEGEELPGGEDFFRFEKVMKK